MRVCVFGAGSLGSALGGILAGKHDVTLVGRRAHVRAVNRHGLRIVGDRKALVRVSAAESLSGLDPPELLIVATKAYDTVEAIESCRTWVSENTLVLTLQNGLGNLELLREWKHEKAFGGTTTMGAYLTKPGVVRISGFGTIVIGSDMDQNGAYRIASAFSSCGLPVTTEREIEQAIWTKAIVSACINPVTAILRVQNGLLLKSTPIVRLLVEVCCECEAVASAAQISLPMVNMPSRVHAVAEGTAKNISSMLQDVILGKRTEIAQINGAFCRIGESKGVSTPLNRALTAMVQALETRSATQKG